MMRIVTWLMGAHGERLVAAIVGAVIAGLAAVGYLPETAQLCVDGQAVEERVR